jgi:DNA-binding PadR family transcriptional regulator
MAKSARPSATIPDLVVLTLLAERPMHGYELNRELEARDVRDWAPISRPQIYYSLAKLARNAWIRRIDGARGGSEPAGPEREVYEATRAGLRVLGESLARDEWATEREVPRFITWMALRHHATPAAARHVIARRREVLARDLAKERATRASFEGAEGELIEAAKLMVEFGIRRFELELAWLDDVERRLWGPAATETCASDRAASAPATRAAKGAPRRPRRGT